MSVVPIRTIVRAMLVLSLVAVAVPGAAPAAAVGIACDPIDPGHCLFPWPNDFFTIPAATATGKRLNLDPLAMPRNAAGVPIDPTDINRNDGFSPGSLIITKVPGLDNTQAFARTDPPPITEPGRSLDVATSPVLVIDAATAEPHPVWTELERAPDLEGNPPAPADTTVLIRPAVNFREGARYVVALRALEDADGNAIGAQDAFAAIKAGDGQAARQQHFDTKVFPVLSEAGIVKQDLYLAWDFTVASERNLSERMLTIRDDAFRQLRDVNLGDGIVDGDSPTFVVDEITQSLPCRVGIDVPPDVDCEQEELDPRVFRRVEGRVIVPCYLNLPGCPSGSRFAYTIADPSIPAWLPGNTMAAPFVCNIPAGAANGERFRPSLYGHGLLGSATQVNTGKLYELGDDGLMFCATDWIGMASEDVPNAVSLLLDLGRFSTLADRVQQGMLNFLYLGRAMIHEEGFGAHAAFRVNDDSVIDPSELFYNGGSQGGIIGGSLTAVAPDFTRAHLGVPGMNYSTLLRRSVDFDIFAEIMYRTYPNELERPLVLSLIQILWDRAESNGYAHHMTDDPYPNTPAHEVLLTPAFGDHQVTNWSTEVMARTVGASLREPPVDPGRYPGGDDKAYWGIPRIGTYPFSDSAMVMAEIGPLRPCPEPRGGVSCDDGMAGANPPPTEEVPNRGGVDPHGPDWSEAPEGFRAIAAWLSHESALPDVCGDAPCYIAGWTGPS